MTNTTDITNAIQQVDETITKALGNSPKHIAPITQHLLSSRGQGVRTRLLVIAATDQQGFLHCDAIQAASAIELFHLATLVHDDIIDDAHTRRGLPSVQSKFGKKQAVICGDYLFGLALSTVADIYEPYTEFAQKFGKNIRLICLGELRQLSNENNLNLHLFDYLRTINGKTAALFHMATFSGAIIGKHRGNLSDSQVKQLGRLGTYFGIIFQILDDCKDYALDIETAKKSTNTDIANGVVNLPLIMAMTKQTTLREKAELAITAKEYGNIIKEVNRHGILPAIDIARRYEKKCHTLLNELPNPMATEFGRLLDAQFLLAERFSQ